MTARHPKPSRRSARARDDADPAVLLPALAHEVRNLLAAIRLSAHLLAREGDARERERSAEEIERLSAQAGALLSQVRPLLGERRGPRVRVRVGELLDAVARSLEGPELAGGAIEVARAPRGIPDVRVDPDALHHALLVLVRAAIDAGGPPVRVGARRTGSRVVFEVRGPEAETASDGRPDALRDREPRALVGRELALAVTGVVVRRDDGRLAVERSARGLLASIALPSVRSARSRAASRG